MLASSEEIDDDPIIGNPVLLTKRKNKKTDLKEWRGNEKTHVPFKQASRMEDDDLMWYISQTSTFCCKVPYPNSSSRRILHYYKFESFFLSSLVLPFYSIKITDSVFIGRTLTMYTQSA